MKVNVKENFKIEGKVTVKVKIRLKVKATEVSAPLSRYGVEKRIKEKLEPK